MSSRMHAVLVAAAVVEANRAVVTVQPGSVEVRFGHADAMGGGGTGRASRNEVCRCGLRWVSGA